MAKKAAPSAPSKKIEKKELAKKAPKNAPAKQKEVKKVDSKKTEAKKTAPKVEKKSLEKAVSKSKEPLKLLSAAGKISTPEKIDKKAGTKTDNKIDNIVDKKQASKATDLVITVVEAAPSDDDGDVASEKPTAPAKKAKLSKSAEAKEKAARQASSDEEARWSDLYEKYKSEKPFVYDMKKQFDANKPLQHKVLGWGWILSNENDRLEVLFKEGRKILISNYVTK